MNDSRVKKWSIVYALSTNLNIDVYFKMTVTHLHVMLTLKSKYMQP